jgi:hypothetical protein
MPAWESGSSVENWVPESMACRGRIGLRVLVIPADGSESGKDLPGTCPFPVHWPQRDQLTGGSPWFLPAATKQAAELWHLRAAAAHMRSERSPSRYRLPYGPGKGKVSRSKVTKIRMIRHDSGRDRRR